MLYNTDKEFEFGVNIDIFFKQEEFKDTKGVMRIHK